MLDTGINTVLNDCEIGRIWGSDAQNFDGTIDDVHIWSRALTANEISTRFNNEDSPSTFYSCGTEQTPVTIECTVGEFHLTCDNMTGSTLATPACAR